MLSIPHMIVVFIIVLVVFGPQKLPELARSLGKLMAEFRKASTDFKSAFEEEMRDLERQAREVERRKAAEAVAGAQPQPATLATPSGSETQSSPPELAASDADARATEAPVITPVPESVARSAESAAEEGGGESLTPPYHEASAALLPPQETTEDASAENPLDAAHDHQQPA
jgi:sec-independent protein translocase protein TatB